MADTDKIVANETPENFLRTSSSANDVESNAALLIPQSRDGFYGYNDEKSLQQVSCRPPCPVSARKHIQIEEKKLAHRRTSDVSTVISDGPSSVPGSFGLSAIREALQANQQQSNAFALAEDEDKARTEPQAQCEDFRVDPNKN